MSTLRGLVLTGSAVALVAGASIVYRSAARADATGAGGGAAAAGADGAVPVVVALYTSEGCSSCPPADTLLTRLAQSQPLPGVRIIPLELHVDYWDAIGWKDPFDSAEFTARQSTYARVHGSNHMYTPEAVVDGASDVVGADEGSLKAAIVEAARRPKVPLRAGFGARGLTIDVPAFAGLPAGGTAAVRVAWVQPQASVEVPRGENGGRTLRHTAIVRQLVTLGTVGMQGGHLEAPAPSDAQLYAVVLLETGDKNETLGTAVASR